MFPSDYKSSSLTVHRNTEDVKHKSNKFTAIITCQRKIMMANYKTFNNNKNDTYYDLWDAT